MLGLTDAQLEIIMTAAPVERRSVFLERVGATLKVRGRFSDADVSDVAKLATGRSDPAHRRQRGVCMEKPRASGGHGNAGDPGRLRYQYVITIMPLNG